jgi:hypothetical protein
MGLFRPDRPHALRHWGRGKGKVLRISGQFINDLLAIRAAILAEAVNFCFALLVRPGSRGE